MARIAKLDLNQLNRQLDRIDDLHKQVAEMKSQLAAVTFQNSQVDFIHARPAFNNLTFTWTGGSQTISWLAGWIKDKNAIIDTGSAFSQSPSFRFTTGKPTGMTHNMAVSAGSLSAVPSTYYWLGWDTANNTMYINTDISKLYTYHSMQVICQLFTGTVGQTGPAGGGGSQGGTDLTGARYKLF